MTLRLLSYTLFTALVAVVALSTGEALYLFAAVALCSIAAVSCLSAFLAWLTFGARCLPPAVPPTRGESSSFTFITRVLSPIPFAPPRLVVRTPTGDERLVAARGIMRSASTISIRCPHTGHFDIGVLKVTISDVFGLFRFGKSSAGWLTSVLILPRFTHVDPIAYAQGGDRFITTSRANIDASAPSGIRAYEYGDAMKRIHWKLSLRKRELLVRTYDAETQPAALILVNQTKPNIDDDLASEADVRDQILDIAASVVRECLEDGATVSLPVKTAKNETLCLRRGDTVGLCLPTLAMARFNSPIRFDEVVRSHGRMMRTMGAVIIVTHDLTDALSHIIAEIARVGPIVRVYYIGGDVPRVDALPTNVEFVTQGR